MGSILFLAESVNKAYSQLIGYFDELSIYVPVLMLSDSVIGLFISFLYIVFAMLAILLGSIMIDNNINKQNKLKAAIYTEKGELIFITIKKTIAAAK